MNAKQLYDLIMNDPEQREAAFNLLECYAQQYPEAENGAVLFHLGLAYFNFPGHRAKANASPEKVFELFTGAEKYNYPVAKLWVGYCYAAGMGVKKDLTSAARLYHSYAQAVPDDVSVNSGKSRLEGLLASNPGHVPALHLLGDIYVRGLGCEQDIITARLYLERAGALNSAVSRHYLGELSVSCNKLEAAKWFLEAAKTPAEKGDNGRQLGAEKLNALANDENADPAIIVMQGEMYENGWGVEQHFAMAERSYQRAADKKYDVAMVKMAELYRNGKGVKRNLKEAFDWFQKAALLNTQNECGSKFAFDQMKEILREFPNDPIMLNKLGFCHYNGRSTPVNFSEAFELFRRSAEGANHPSLFNLGFMYFSGHGVSSDYVLGVKFMYKAAIAKGRADTSAFFQLQKFASLTPAEFELGACHYRGLGTNVNYAVAYEKFSGLPNDERALYYLGMMYEKGLGVEKKAVRAAEMYYKSAKINGTREEGSTEAAKKLEAMAKCEPPELTAVYNIGLCYMDGLGVERDREKAANSFAQEIECLLKELSGNIEAKNIAQKVKRIIELNKLIFENDLKALGDTRAASESTLRLQNLQREILHYPDKFKDNKQSRLRELQQDNSPYAKRIRDYSARDEKIQYCIEQRRKCLLALRNDVAVKIKHNNWRQTLFVLIESGGVVEIEEKLNFLDRLLSPVELLGLYTQIEALLEAKAEGSEIFYNKWRNIFRDMSFETDFDWLHQQHCGMATTGKPVFKLQAALDPITSQCVNRK